MLRIGFDVGGVISKYPEKFYELLAALDFCAGHGAPIELYILTDMHPLDKVKETLKLNNLLQFFTNEEILIADYEKYGEAAKAVLCREHKIDIFIDDFIGYVADPGATIRLLLMPDSTKPYWADSWKVTDNHDFGRRRYDKN